MLYMAWYRSKIERSVCHIDGMAWLIEVLCIIQIVVYGESYVDDVP